MKDIIFLYSFNELKLNYFTCGNFLKSFADKLVGI